MALFIARPLAMKKLTFPAKSSERKIITLKKEANIPGNSSWTRWSCEVMESQATNAADVNLVVDPVGSRCQKLFLDFLEDWRDSGRLGKRRDRPCKAYKIWFLWWSWQPQILPFKNPWTATETIADDCGGSNMWIRFRFHKNKHFWKLIKTEQKYVFGQISFAQSTSNKFCFSWSTVLPYVSLVLPCNFSFYTYCFLPSS